MKVELTELGDSFDLIHHPKSRQTFSKHRKQTAINFYNQVLILFVFLFSSTNDTSIEVYEVDVHYQSDVFIQYRTSLEFTSIDLIGKTKQN